MAAEGLKFFTKGDNADYFAEDLLLVSEYNAGNLRQASTDAYKILCEAATHVVTKRMWDVAGIPPNAVQLVEWSFLHEKDRHLMGRFDFAGGFEQDEIKLLEYNADTFSLLPETAWVQPHILRETGNGVLPAFNEVEQRMVQFFKRLLANNPNRNPTLLLSWMGFEEDLLNVEVIARAARQAGFREVQLMLLEKVVFDPEEGIFIDLGREQYRQYDFWYKLAPWDFIAYDEPDLMEILTEIIMQERAVVINPAWTMLLQSKGLLQVASDLYPNHPLLLKTTARASDFPDNRYAEKPIFGRVGDNVRLFDGGTRPVQENDGDYGHLPKVYQALTVLESDPQGYRYQPSVFTVDDAPAAFCVRRQEDLIIDDDAEFIACGML
jgi:glutathionylspermidine synthase